MRQNLSPGAGWLRLTFQRIPEWFLFLPLVLSVYVILDASIGRKPHADFQEFRISDLHYRLAVVRAFWTGEIPTVYRFEYQKAAVENAFGVDLVGAMPLGDTPTALLVYLPFSLLGTSDFLTAHALWISVSLVILFSALGKILKPNEKTGAPLSVILLLSCVFAFSYETVRAVILGQMALMACGLILLLLHEIGNASDTGKPLRRWPVYAAIFVLSAKIPYLLIGLGILFLYGFLYESIVSFLLVACAVGGMGLWKGFGLFTDWAHQLQVFSSLVVQETYASSFVSVTMVTLSSAFQQLGYDSSIVPVSRVILLAGTISIFSVGGVRYLPLPISSGAGGRAMSHRLAISLIGLLLLFLPYLGGYEDIMLLVPFCIVLSGNEQQLGNKGKVLPVMFLAGLLLNHNTFPAWKPIALLWLIKLIVINSLIFLV